jgi:transcriptional regulator with XRE-family HTH domain
MTRERFTYNYIEKSSEMGLKLKAARLEKGYSQGELGKILGVTHACIGSYERGRLRISVDILHEFSKILQKPIEYFIEDNPELLEKYRLKKETPRYDLLDDLEFAIEMDLKNYFKIFRIQNSPEKIDKILKFIKKEALKP